jgi:hypothetical protein
MFSLNIQTIEGGFTMKTINRLISVTLLLLAFSPFLYLLHMQQHAAHAQTEIQPNTQITIETLDLQHEELEADIRFIKAVMPILKNPRHPLYRQVYQAVYEKPPS